MSALGDYIHLTAKGYERYGVARPGQQASFTKYMSARDFIQTKVNNNISQISKNELNTLKERLKANSQDSNAMNKKIEQRINNWNAIILEIIASGLKNWESGIGQFQSLLQNDNNNFSFPSERYEVLKKRWQTIQFLRDDIEKTIDLINKAQQPQSISLLQSLKLKYQRYASLNPNADKNASTLEEIKKAMTDSIFQLVYNQIAGKWGEMIVATCDDVAYNKAVKTIDQAVNFFQKSVQGDNKTNISIPKSHIAVPMSMKTSDANQNYYFINATQDKVDISITVNDKDVLASVKSYRQEDTSGARVHLQEDLNLFYTISFLNQNLKNFGNHWLNLHASHKDGSVQNNIENLDAIVAKEIAFQALSHGNPYKNTKNANVFVYINRFYGDIFVESVSQLLLTKFYKFGNLENKITNIHFNNERAKSWQERISNILTQLHTIKINVNYYPYSNI